MSNVLDAVLAQYEKNQIGGGAQSKMSQDERMKKYFALILSDKEKSGQRRVRILPTHDGSSPFKEAWYHEIQVGGQWNKFYDPGKNDNERSPLNEVYEELMSTGKESDKELAKQYKSRKFYIVKVIDRDNEEDGVKFWRFKHKYTGDGIMDKIIPLFKLKGDVTDPREGRDIIITTGRNDKNFSVVNSIMADDVSILTTDKEKANDWFNNSETHKDVYSKKSQEYLEIVATNKTPIWDSEQSKFVAEEDKEEKETASLSEEINMMKSESFKQSKNDSIVESEDDDDDYDFETTSLDSDDDDDELPF